MKNHKSLQQTKNVALLDKKKSWIPRHIWLKLPRKQQNAHKAKVYAEKALRQQQYGTNGTPTFNSWIDPSIWRGMSWELRQEHLRKVAEFRGQPYQPKKINPHKGLRPGFAPAWIEPHIWKKMSRIQQSQHKTRIANQAAIIVEENKAKVRERLKFNMFFKRGLAPKLAHLFFQNYLDKVGKNLVRNFTPKLTQKLRFTFLAKRPSFPILWRNHAKQKLHLVSRSSVFRPNLKLPGTIKAILLNRALSRAAALKRKETPANNKKLMHDLPRKKFELKLLGKKQKAVYFYTINLKKAPRLWKSKNLASKRTFLKQTPPIFFTLVGLKA